ncbi:protein translocase subunit [Mitosporidium daphniae]|uniref:Mitochondrial import inner membrane translocase subunit TIM44 n=1 Tax=Mitosporidium daphniae TaxID=1485682 RepID=A0A098VSY9_9MICR|nr:mitochondrial import inner membrane translocase subunit TIM44 [Mitosporidium daphniae]KGG50821.1 mitochondrial import inner membrane translocase subunit TIM44 [Mitosporidium daphniae]|eukprot:XP_013237248.1 mitochondrial import inner membrane translocase subunit TIM44 [Mitosporidium daphniae]
MLFKRLLPAARVIGVRWNSGSKKGIFSEILDSVRNEVSKDDELQASLTRMEARLTDVKQNPALRAVKDATKTLLSKNAHLVNELSRLQKKGDELIISRLGRRRAKKSTLGASPSTPPASMASKVLDATRETVSESKIIKNFSRSVSSVQSTLVDETDSYLYGGFSHRELRRHAVAKRKSPNSAGSKLPIVEENPDAGTALSISEQVSTIKGRVSNALSTAWSNLCQQNPVIKKAFEVRRSYEESNNIFVFLARSLTSTVSSPFKSFLFKESETAQVVKEIRQMDPSFSVESFLAEATKVIIPDILEAIILLDRPALKSWCSESLFAALSATLSPHLIGEGQILDLRHVDLVTAKISNDLPILVVSFSTQQISCIKNSITGEVSRGSLDSIESVFYMWALAKTPDVDPLTGGWRLIEMSARDARSGF